MLIKAETHRVYLNTEKPLRMVDGVLHPKIGSPRKFRTIVGSWNSFPEEAAAMKDLGQDQLGVDACVLK